MDAPRLLGRPRVDGDDIRMRVQRAHNSCIELIGQLEIVKKSDLLPATGARLPGAALILRLQICYDLVEPKCDAFLR